MKKMFISVIALAMSVMAMATETAYVELRLTGNSGLYDEMTLTEDDSYTNAYEEGSDAAKIMYQANTRSVLIYGMVDGLECGDVAAANLDRHVVGFMTNMIDDQYTLSFEVVDLDPLRTLTLFDRVTGISHDIVEGESFNFSVPAAQVGRVAVNDRFVINYTAPASVRMKGDFTNPDAEWEYTSDFTDDGTTYSLALDLAADTWYHFQLEEVYGSAIIAANGAAFDREHPSYNIPVDGWHAQLTLYADAAGTYTFTWDDVADYLTITFPAAPVPTCTTVRTGLNVGQYYTICLPKNVTAYEGASFWNMSNRGADVAYLEEEIGELVAGRPYIIQAEAATLCVTYGTDEAAAGANGALVGTFAAMGQDDLDAAATAAGSDIYLLNTNELWKVNGQSDNQLAANRAYIVYNLLNVSTPQPAPGRRVRAIPMQNQGITGVENLNAGEAPVKMMIDGEMFILRGEHMFDATGRMVK